MGVLSTTFLVKILTYPEMSIIGFLIHSLDLFIAYFDKLTGYPIDVIGGHESISTILFLKKVVVWTTVSAGISFSSIYILSYSLAFNKLLLIYLAPYLIKYPSFAANLSKSEDVLYNLKPVNSFFIEFISSS